MNDVTRAFGETPPAGPLKEGRIHHPPTSIEQAKARVVYQMDHLEANCRDGIDVAYAIRCFDEALGDYCEAVLG